MSEPEARVGEELVDQARLYGMSVADAHARTEAMLGQLDLEGTSARQVKTLSGGQRRRLDIALGLVHAPRCCSLTSQRRGGTRRRARTCGSTSKAFATGTTIFLTTHYLAEADLLCDRILVIEHGQIVAHGTLEALKRSVGSDSVALTLADAPQAALAEKTLAALGAVGAEHAAGTTVQFRLAAASVALPAVFDALSSAGVRLA